MKSQSRKIHFSETEVEEEIGVVEVEVVDVVDMVDVIFTMVIKEKALINIIAIKPNAESFKNLIKSIPIRIISKMKTPAKVKFLLLKLYSLSVIIFPNRMM